MKRCFFANAVIISLLMLFVFTRPAVSKLNITDDEKLDLLTMYAPLVYFDKKEIFYPSSVEWSFNYLKRVSRESEDGKYCLSTKEDLSNPGEVLQYFRGFDGETEHIIGGRKQLNNEAPVYAFWNERSYGRHTVVGLVYFFYYPYNKGKEVPALEDDYGYSHWGNHVGDWENVIVWFLSSSHNGISQPLRPVYVEYSIHSYAMAFDWETVTKDGDTHPVAYSAWGSHGNWPYADEGGNLYLITKEFLNDYGGIVDVMASPFTSRRVKGEVRLYDNCSKGKPWYTWNNIEAFELEEYNMEADPPKVIGKKLNGDKEWPKWMNNDFEVGGNTPNDPRSGAIYRWGNEEGECVEEFKIFGVFSQKLEICVLENGPTGPVSKGEVWNQTRAVIHVNPLHGDSGDVAYNGTAEYPFRTIQKGLDTALYCQINHFPTDQSRSAIVLVHDGKYKGKGNVYLEVESSYYSFWIPKKYITVISESGPEGCTIDCGKNSRAFTFRNGRGTGSIVDGFTIQNGNVEYGGGICCYYSSPTISNMIIMNNKADNGGGISCWESSPTIINTIIEGNTASKYGGGIYCDSNSSPTIINTIAARNKSSSGGGGISCYGGSPKIINTTITGNLSGKGIHFGNKTTAELTNTIIWNNAPGEIQGNWGAPIFTCCDVKGGWSGVGTGNINKDPLFVDAANGNYHLSVYSSCIGAGTEDDAPDRDIAGNPRPNPDGYMPDIGAYESSLGAPDEGFYITLTSPTGGEIWRGGSSRDITWNGPASFHQISIVYSTDGGNTYPITIASSLNYANVYKWNLPVLESTSVRVKVIALDSDSTELASDSSDADFTITSSPVLISVPGDITTIQAAMDAAMDGDTVQVADGLYTEGGNVNLDFKGKAITVRSENGAGNCIIDCERTPLTRGFHFHSGESLDSIVEGFTIRNGLAAEYDPFNTGELVIVNGGGILCSSASPTIRNNIIKENITSGSGGGILCENNSSPLIIGNTIVENATSNGNGGGIACEDSSPIIASNIIGGNSSQQGVGGGIACQNSYAKIENNVITDNSVYFEEPYAAGGGGGIYCADGSSVQSINNTIAENGNSGSAGGLVEVRGGGVYCGIGSFLAIKNTILWGNKCYGILEQAYEGDGQINISYSDIQGGWPGTGNINADPQFADSTYSSYHLSYFSPCIGAGTGSDAPDRDIEDNLRPSPESSKPDMGAYENALSTAGEGLHITLEYPNGGELWRGGSIRNILWDSSVPFDHVRLIYSTDGGNTYPYTIAPSAGDNGIYEWDIPDLESLNVRVKAIAEDLSNNELASDVSNTNFAITASPILISVPEDCTTIQAAIDAAIDSDTVQIADGVYTGAGNVYLDFRGKAITVRSENGPEVCTIDCENVAIGLLFHGGEGPDSILDGLTIKNGRAPEITFPEGEKYSFGGSILCLGSGPTIANTIITESTAVFGGGIFCWGPCSPVITNSVIRGNIAGYGGGIFCVYSANPIIANTTIAGNTANYGSGISCFASSSPSLTNTILWNNGSGEIYLYDESSIQLTYCDVREGWAGVGNIKSDPLFVDAANSDHHLSDFSPCIGAGIIADAQGKDIEGNPRPFPSGSNPDMGAYENKLGQPLFHDFVRQMDSGWNMVSFSVNKCFYQGIAPTNQPACVEMVDVVNDLKFGSLSEWFSSVVAPGDAWQMVIGSAGAMDSSLDPIFHSLKYISPCEGYWVKVKPDVDNASLNLDGGLFDPACAIPLSAGWSLVGCHLAEGCYDSDTEPEVEWINDWMKVDAPVAKHVLSSIDGKYSMVIGGYGAYNPALPPAFSSLHFMACGFAYWLKMSSAGSLVYSPDSGNSSVYAAPGLVSGIPTMPSRLSMVVYGSATCDDGELPEGSRIEVFTQSGVLCGQATVTHDGSYGMMMVYGNEPGTPQVEGARPDENLRIHVNGQPVENDGKIRWMGDKSLLRSDLMLRSRPEVSKLSQNYPNPFNPDTWIPYELKEDSGVTIRIYTAGGQLVRTLSLGKKSAGFYSDKARAAHWDGRNEAGESVSSGVYFYNISASELTDTRKMVITR